MDSALRRGRITRVRVLAAIVAAALVGCGAAASDERAAVRPGPTTYHDSGRGYTVTFPAHWHRAEERLLPTLLDPVEILSLATFPLQRGDQACWHGSLEGFTADDVFLTILERGLDPGSSWPDFPARPERFRFESGQQSEFGDCLRKVRGIELRDHWFRFSDAGRHFHVLVAIGASASEQAADEAYRILDSLAFDPSVQPDWRSSG
jgi:hypothetical protein